MNEFKTAAAPGQPTSGEPPRDLKIVYVTSGENGLYGLQHLCRQGFSIRTVVTISRSVARRNRVSGFADVTGFCRQQNLPVITLDTYQLAPEDLGRADNDLLIVNGWNRLIRAEVLSMFRYGGLGVHAGHPPIGLGRAPLPWNVIKGFRDVEVYVFRLTERADDGEILAIQTVEITPWDDVRTLYEKVMLVGAQMFESVLRAFCRGEPSGRPQDRSHVVLYPKRSPDDGLIDFYESAESIFNFVRAQSRPYPGAFAQLDSERWYIWRAVPFDRYAFRDLQRVPGRIIAALPSGLIVQTGTSPLWILEATCGDRQVVPDTLDNLEQYVGRTLKGSESLRSQTAA